MIYQIKNMLLNVTQELLKGEVNDVVVCQDLSAVTKVFYTVLVIKDHDVAKKILKIYEESGTGSEKTYITKGTYQDNYLMVFPYEEERELERFFKAEIDNLDNLETLCSEVVIKCITSGIPFPIMYLQFQQKKINKSKAGEIFFSYALDLKDLSENIGERECVTLCAKTLFSMLSRITNESTVSYTLLMKKTNRDGYFKFIDLYKDIQAATMTIDKRKLWVRIKMFFSKHGEKIYRFILAICLTAAVIALVMLLSQLIFGDIPLYRIFVNTFKKIGTESMLQ
ncbi:MAG: hypothetical protein IJA34_13735 [Lachnospiraceae bacterium]|nr:hypothetical protein [Lachnospiraceae bacterium]